MKTIRSRILLSVCLLLLSFCAIFTVIYYLNMRREIIKGYDEQLRSQAVDIASLLDVEAHERLRYRDQMFSDDYLRLYDRLNHIMTENDLAYIFTIRLQEGRWIYVLDSGEGDDQLPLGSPYNEGRPLDPEEIMALSGKTVVSDIYVSRFGTFKSAYAPLRDAEGQTVGLLVVDIDASAIAATLRDRLLTLTSLVLVLLIFAIVIAGAISGSITKPLNRMALRAQRIAAGDLDVPLATQRQDEIGTVARTIDSMVKRLREMIAEKEETAGELATFNRSLEDLVAERTQALTDSEARYRFLTERAMVGIYLLQDGVIRYLNPAMAAMVGYDAKDLLGTKVEELIHPEDLAMYRENIKKRMDGEVDNARYTLRANTREGSFATMEVSGALIDFEGKPAIYGTARDISEQVRLEKMLRRSQRLESLGQIAGGIAHEFNNLLSPIVGYAELLKNRLKPLAREDLLRPVDLIEKAGNRSASLVQAILTFAREAEYQLAPVDLTEVLEETMALLKQTIPRNIAVEAKLAANLPLVEAESGEIQSAILNLCLNARDAMPEGGSLTITTRSVELDENFHSLYHQCPPGRYVQAAVRDTGHGIDEEILSKIFDPFFTTKKNRGGNGLGLAAAYGTIQNHGGQLTVESKPLQGSTFSIYLPVTDKAPLASREKTIVLPEGQERLLVVDDDEGIRSLYSDLLGELGYHVCEAGDGTEAMRILRADSVKLVVLDINMPRMDGPQTLQEIRILSPNLPVLVASGVSKFPWDEHAGDDHLRFMAKPFRIENMAQTVREMLDHS